MITKLYARGVANPIIAREAQIGDTIVYSDDRHPGIRLTVLSPVTLKVIYDHNYNTHFANGVSRLKDDIKKFSGQNNILIITSSGASKNDNWTNGFTTSDFSFFASMGFNHLNSEIKNTEQASYVAIKNDNNGSFTDKLGSHTPVFVTLYAKTEPTNEQKIKESLSFFGIGTTQKQQEKQAQAEPTVTGAAVGTNTISIGGLTGVAVLGFLIYKIVEKTSP